MIRFLILIIFNATLIEGENPELHVGNGSYLHKLSMTGTNTNTSKLTSLLVIEGEPLMIPCLQDLKLRKIITSYQWQRHNSGDKEHSLGSQFVTLKENTRVLHITKTSIDDEGYLQCVAKTQLGQIIIKNFVLYITPNRKNMDQDYEELKNDKSSFIKTLDLRTFQGWLAFIICLWTSLIIGYGFVRFLFDFVTRLRQMHQDRSATVCSIIIGLLKDLHTNINPFAERGQMQSYQSDFGELEERNKKQIKELNDLLSVFRTKINSLEIQLGLLDRAQRRPEARVGHLSHYLGSNLNLQAQMGNDVNQIYDSPKYARAVKHEISGHANELNGNNSDTSIYESLLSITPSTEENN